MDYVLHIVEYADNRQCGNKNVLYKKSATRTTSTTWCQKLPVLKNPLFYSFLPFSLQRKRTETTKSHIYGNSINRKKNL